VLNVADPKRTGLRFDGCNNETGFCAARTFDLAGALLEFGVAAPDDGEQEIEPRSQFVFALMPALGTAVKAFVIIFLRFLGESFKADVTANFTAVLVKRQQREQARHAAIAIAKRMDAKKIKDESGNGDDWRDIVLIERVPVEQAEFVHGRRSFLCGNATKTNDGRSAGNELDDFVVHALELSGVAAGRLGEEMKMF
jgi:hypothetical protein